MSRHCPLNPIGDQSQRGEVRHLSTPRKRKNIDSPSSGERTGKSLNPSTLACGGVAGSVRFRAGESKTNTLADLSGKSGHRG